MSQEGAHKFLTEQSKGLKLKNCLAIGCIIRFLADFRTGVCSVAGDISRFIDGIRR